MTGSKDSESTSYDDQITVTLAEPTLGDPEPRDGSFWEKFKTARWDLIVPLLVFMGLVVGGVTTSSVGIGTLRVDGSTNDAVFGAPLGIRSDEYRTGTPTRIGFATMGAISQLNPLAAESNFTIQAPAGPFSTLTFFDTGLLTLGTVVPVQMLFAFVWWLPFLLLALGLPYVIKFLTGERWPGWVAFALIVASPVDLWWSHQTVGILGFVVAGSAALVKSCFWFEERVIWKGVLWGIISVVLLARTPFQYQPWMLVLAPVTLLMVIVPLVSRKERWRQNLTIVVGVAVLSLGLFGLSAWETREGLLASSQTVYPGSRRATGGPVPVWLLFGAPQMHGFVDQEIIGSNHSEISSSFLALGILALIVVVSGYSFQSSGHRNAWLVTAWGTGFWLAWSLINFGSVGASIPILSMVTANRSAAVVGVLATLAFSLTLGGRRKETGTQLPLAAGAIGFLLTGYAGSEFQASVVPGLSTRHVVITSLIVGLLFFSLAKWPRSWAVYGALLLGSFVLIDEVNPIQVGLADVRDSELASALRMEGELARAKDTLWATDSLGSFDPLLTANAVPSLSSRQMSGPNVSAWEKLDPLKEQEEAWNRGGSFVTFLWTDDSLPIIENPWIDIIQVSVDPCELGERFPELTTIVSYEPLDRACLKPNTTLPEGQDGVIEFGNAQRFIYDLIH